MADARPVQYDDIQRSLLVLRCQAGDERAFGQLLDAFGPRTLGYLRGMLGDDAEDVQQEVWLSVYRSIATLADPGAFRTWLFSTTRRRAIDHLRRLKRDHAMFDDGADDIAAGQVSPQTADLAIDMGDLDALLASLPGPQREVVVLRYRDEMSYAEIALITGSPIGTVRTRLHHAKRKLRDIMQGSES